MSMSLTVYLVLQVLLRWADVVASNIFHQCSIQFFELIIEER